MTSRRPYLVIVERNGRVWRAEVEGVGRVQARDLAEVEPNARKLVWACRGVQPDDIALDVEVQLPHVIQIRLNLADQLCDEATIEVEGAINYLVELGVSLADVGCILRRRREQRTRRLPPPAAGGNAFTITWRASA